MVEKFYTDFQSTQTLNVSSDCERMGVWGFLGGIIRLNIYYVEMLYREFAQGHDIKQILTMQLHRSFLKLACSFVVCLQDR